MFIVFAGILACTLTSEQPVPSPEEMRDVEVLSQRETLLRPLYTLGDSVEDVVPFRGPEEDALLGLLIRWDDATSAAPDRASSRQVRAAVKDWIETLSDRASGEQNNFDGVCSPVRR